MRKAIVTVLVLAASAAVAQSIGGITVTKVSPPQRATLSDCTGALPDYLYGYRVSAINEVGETTTSLEALTILSGSGGDAGVVYGDGSTPTRGVLVKWPKVNGAKGYRVYGRVADAGALITTIYDSETTSYCDTGSVTPSGLATSVNTTGDSTVQGLIYSDGMKAARRTLPVCDSTIDGTDAVDILSGGADTYLRTKKCFCTSNGDPDAGVAYSWLNVASNKTGTSTTCGAP